MGAGREKKEKFPPIFFSYSRFLNSTGPTISEPGTGYTHCAINPAAVQPCCHNVLAVTMFY